MNLGVAVSLLGCLFLASCGGNEQRADVAEEELWTEEDWEEPVYQDRPVTPYPEAAEVRLFVGADADDLRSASERDRLSGDVLTEQERERLAQALVARTIVSGVAEGSLYFIPHHFFGFYDEAGTMIGELELCFCCYEIREAPEFIEGSGFLSADFPALESLVSDMGHPIDLGC